MLAYAKRALMRSAANEDNERRTQQVDETLPLAILRRKSGPEESNHSELRLLALSHERLNSATNWSSGKNSRMTASSPTQTSVVVVASQIGQPHLSGPV